MEKKDWKFFCRKYFVLPGWLIVLFCVISAGALLFLFWNGLNESIVAYAVYVFSFYTLTVTSIACSKTVPNYYRKMKKGVYENPYGNRYFTDPAFKTHVNVFLSFGVNVFYIGINAVSAIFYRTHWFAIFAVYYAIMAVLHFLLVRYMGQNQIGESRLKEWKRSRICAILLLTVNITLSAVVLMMVYYNRGFSYRGYLIYVMAAYTFYTTTAAVVNLIKYRKYQSPIMSVSKIIKLASSLFSMLFLETAMFAQFGQDTSEKMKQIMIMATGAGICVIVVTMSLYMIVLCSKEIAKQKRKLFCDADDAK